MNVTLGEIRRAMEALMREVRSAGGIATEWEIGTALYSVLCAAPAMVRAGRTEYRMPNLYGLPFTVSERGDRLILRYVRGAAVLAVERVVR